MDFVSNCTNESSHNLVSDNLSWSISGMVSFFLTFVILSLLLFHKAYATVLQRLFLYFIFVTLMQLACIAMNIEILFVDGNNGLMFCKWLGFLQHWAYMMNWLFSISLTSYLHFMVYHQIQGKSLPKLSFKKAVAAEMTLVTCVLLFPLLLLWIPFSAYGINGSLCWTIHVNEDCSNNKLGSTFELIYTYCCVVVRLLIMTSFVIVFIFYCHFAFRYSHTRPHYLKTVGRTIALMSLLIISASIELVGLLTYIHTAVVSKHITTAVLQLYKIDYVVLPVSLAITPAGFLLYLYSVKKFSWESMKKAALEWRWCCSSCRQVRRVYVRLPKPHPGEDATAPASTRETAPSETYFKISYTGAFTNVTEQDVQRPEVQPLVRNANAPAAPISSGYESFVSTRNL